MTRKRRALIVGLSVLGILAASLAYRAVTSRSSPHAQAQRLAMTMMEVRRAAEMWREREPAACPTPERLKRDRLLDRASPVLDSWGTPLRIVCETDETVVVSSGPDGRAGTADDIEVPEPNLWRKP